MPSLLLVMTEFILLYQTQTFMFIVQEYSIGNNSQITACHIYIQLWISKVIM